MSITKTTRKRGVILSATGWDKFQKVKRSFEFQDNDGSRYTLEQLSDRTNLSLHTISRIIARVEGVDKLSLEYCFRAFGLELDKNDYTRPSGAQTVDWGEAVDVSAFNGRSEELAQLQKWVSLERCRSVAVLGMGGIGKTSVAVKFAQQVQHEFDYVIWRSLSQAPPVDTFIADLVYFLSNQQETKGDIGRLMHYLRNSRCLLILDKMESVLDADHAGHYRPRYEGYRELLRLVGETAHQSCLILTSREKPAEIAAGEGTELSVRCLRLGGSQEAAFALLASKGLVESNEQKQQLCDSPLEILCERYGNNPKALKIVATSIYDLFNGDIEEFLKQDTLIFNGIRRLLDEQFNRLSQLEQSIMYWLAINREWTSIADLRDDIVPCVSTAELLEALEGLNGRSLIETDSSYYTLQPLVMEYITNKLTKQMADELTTKELSFFIRYALIKTTANNIVKQSQEKLILQPIAELFCTNFYLARALERQIQEIFQVLDDENCRFLGYGVSNLTNLCRYLRLDITSYGFSDSTIQHVSEKKKNLRRINFVHVNQAKAV
jgi:hypothetical protein